MVSSVKKWNIYPVEGMKNPLPIKQKNSNIVYEDPQLIIFNKKNSTELGHLEIFLVKADNENDFRIKKIVVLTVFLEAINSTLNYFENSGKVIIENEIDKLRKPDFITKILSQDIEKNEELLQTQSFIDQIAIDEYLKYLSSFSAITNGIEYLINNSGNQYDQLMKHITYIIQLTYKEFYVNGNKYEGEFKGGIPNGRGTLFYKNGDKYAGEFKDGLFDGQGCFITASNISSFIGVYANGVKVFGLLKTNKETYMGQFKNDLYHGYGMLPDEHDNQLSGYFINGEIDPTQNYIVKYWHGEVHCGPFDKNWKLMGECVILTQNNSIYLYRPKGLDKNSKYAIELKDERPNKKNDDIYVEHKLFNEQSCLVTANNNSRFIGVYENEKKSVDFLKLIIYRIIKVSLIMTFIMGMAY